MYQGPITDPRKEGKGFSIIHPIHLMFQELSESFYVALYHLQDCEKEFHEYLDCGFGK